MVTALFMGSPGYAETISRSAEVTVAPVNVATKGVAVNANGTVVKVDKVSDPVLLVRASSATTVPSIDASAHAAGANGCSVADNPAAGQLNRRIVVTVAAGESGNVYAKLTYVTTDVTTGNKTPHTVEPFTPNGLSVTAPPGTEPIVVPVAICVD